MALAIWDWAVVASVSHTTNVTIPDKYPPIGDMGTGAGILYLEFSGTTIGGAIHTAPLTVASFTRGTRKFSVVKTNLSVHKVRRLVLYYRSMGEASTVPA